MNVKLAACIATIGSIVVVKPAPPASARRGGPGPAAARTPLPESGLTRPICSYPQYTTFKGSGNIKGASNWSCVSP